MIVKTCPVITKQIGVDVTADEAEDLIESLKEADGMEVDMHKLYSSGAREVIVFRVTFKGEVIFTLKVEPDERVQLLA